MPVPFIQEGIRCTIFSRQPIGGMELREMLPGTFPFVTPVRESSLRINESSGCCNPHEYPSGSGKGLLWISSCNCLGASLDMTLFR
jgi:hypothetical protein